MKKHIFRLGGQRYCSSWSNELSVVSFGLLDLSGFVVFNVLLAHGDLLQPRREIGDAGGRQVVDVLLLALGRV